MVKVLGFDVGIKNLAFCIVEKQDDKFVINDHINNWNIINLTEQDKLKCEFNGCINQISNNAIVNTTCRYYCTKHKLYHKAILLKEPINFTEDNSNLKCSHSCSCKTKAKWIDNNNNYCPKHKVINEKRLEKERTLIKYKTFVKDFTIHDLKLILLQKLDTYKDIFLQVDIVCIENQPAFKNPTMKAISDVLYTWFMVRGLIEKELNNSIISKITFFAPSNKLKIANNKDDNNEQIENSTNKYKKTKELGITNCLEFINYNQEYVDHLNSFKKKDDLCDAFLHGVYYIEKNFTVKETKKTDNILQVEESINTNIKIKPKKKILNLDNII